MRPFSSGRSLDETVPRRYQHAMSWHETHLLAGPVPLWFQIANLLRSAIVAGEFKPGERLPSEAELNKAFSISRTTARAALDKLEQEGLIARASGRGSTVLDRRIEQPVNLLAGFAEDMRRRGLVPSYNTLSARFAIPPSEVRQAMRVAGGRAFRIVRRLSADGIPMAMSTSWIAPSVLAGTPPPSRRDLDAGSLYKWLEGRCGVRIAGGHEFIEAQSLAAPMAAQLGIGPGAAALVARRLSCSAAGDPIEYAVMTYRADRYRFRLDLSQTAAR